MPKRRSWTIEQLANAVATSKSYRKVLIKLNLRPTGGNYDQLKRYLDEYNITFKSYSGKAWNKGMKGIGKPIRSLESILVQNCYFPSYQLKLRLFNAGLKHAICEHCGWAQKTTGGYVPVELDHINGDRHDNRIENLRILCPNCHSLTPTYRGRGRQKYSPGC